MNKDALLLKAQALQLHGVVAHWGEICQSSWIEPLLEWEEVERSQRSLQRRLVQSQIGRFKPLSDFDWNWPKKCDRGAVEELMGLDFLKGSMNIIFCGPNGVGKSTMARNIAYQAIMAGHTALFITAAEMLGDLEKKNKVNALDRRINYYAKPTVLCIDEMGYLSYSNRDADLLFQIVSRRYEEKSTIVTTNKPFTEWGNIFPNTTCVVSLIDRLVHRSEIVSIEADSFRLKEAKEQALKRKERRVKNKDKTNP